MRTLQQSVARCAAVAILCLVAQGSTAWADPMLGETVWAQLPVDEIGENIASNVDWRFLSVTHDLLEIITVPNWVMADDFFSDGRPIGSVRWWGSYSDISKEPVEQNGSGFVSTIEEGFFISFHTDIPVDENPNGEFSMPGELLATYSTWDIHIEPTDLIGWDGHRVWEYSVRLGDTHPEVLTPVIAEPNHFNQEPGEIYWISIVAQNGLEMDAEWNSFPNNDPVEAVDFWGWHTSPDRFNDVPVTGKLAIPPPNDWQYGNWWPEPQSHTPGDMAFELFTMPEPSSLLLAAFALLGLLAHGHRRR